MQQLIAMMEYRGRRLGYKNEDIALIMHITEPTYYRRKREPKEFKVNELLRLCKKLNITITITPDGKVRAEAPL